MLADRIAILRKTIGLSQSQLAHTLHLGPSAVGMYEQGRRTPNIDILVAMAQLFGVSLDYLLTGAEFQGNHEIYPQLHTCPCQGCCHRKKCCER